MRVGITYNLRSDTDNMHPEHLLVEDAFEEFDTEDTIDAIADVLGKANHSVIKLGWGRAALKQLISSRIDFVFNVSEGYWGRNRESQMPALLEMLEIPHSGSDPLALSLALDKISAKQILKYNKIKTPDYFVINKREDVEILPQGLKYPLFVKPAWEGSSKGISQSSKICKKECLSERADYLLNTYPGQPILVEQYIPGREFTVGVLGNEKPVVLGVMEIMPKAKKGEDFFYSIEVKRDWQNLVSYECPARISEHLNKQLQTSAIKAFKAFGLRDIARIDFRMNNSGDVYFIEINPLPGLSPKYSDIVIMARKMGWAYESLVTTIFNNAVSRYKTDLAYEKI